VTTRNGGSSSTAHDVLRLRKVLATNSKLSNSGDDVEGPRSKDPRGRAETHVLGIGFIFAMVEVALDR